MLVRLQEDLNYGGCQLLAKGTVVEHHNLGEIHNLMEVHAILQQDFTNYVTETKNSPNYKVGVFANALKRGLISKEEFIGRVVVAYELEKEFDDGIDIKMVGRG